MKPTVEDLRPPFKGEQAVESPVQRPRPTDRNLSACKARAPIRGKGHQQSRFSGTSVFANPASSRVDLRVLILSGQRAMQSRCVAEQEVSGVVLCEQGVMCRSQSPSCKRKRHVWKVEDATGLTIIGMFPMGDGRITHLAGPR